MYLVSQPLTNLTNDTYCYFCVTVGETLRNTSGVSNASSRPGAQDGISLHTDRGSNTVGVVLLYICVAYGSFTTCSLTGNAVLSSEEHAGEGDRLRLG